MDSSTLVSVLHDPDPSTVRDIVERLVSANELVAPPEDYRALGVVARENGSLVGGALGHTHWGWLFVSHLWVAESHRGLGVGSALMVSIERAAVVRGAGSAHLDTYDFQALGFYERIGYRIFAQLDDYPVGHTRYFLQRRLGAAD